MTEDAGNPPTSEKPRDGDDHDAPYVPGLGAQEVIDRDSLAATRHALENELAVIRDVAPLAGFLDTAESARAAYEPMLKHMAEFQRIFDNSALIASTGSLLANLAPTQALLDSVAKATAPLATLQITQDAAQTAAWGSILATAAMPSPLLLQQIDSVIGSMSLDISKHISLQAKILGDVRISLPESVLGSAARIFDVADWMSGSLSSALVSFESTKLNVVELAPVAFSTSIGAGVTGFVFPAERYPRSGDVVELETEIRAAGIELVRLHQPGIAKKLEGARFALKGGNPDATSQAANSLVESIDQLLREVIDEALALEWCQEFCPNEGVYMRGQNAATTRTGKLRYLAHERGIRETIAKGIVDVVTGTMSILQQAKHDDSSEAIIRNFVVIVEGWAGAVISMTLRN